MIDESLRRYWKEWRRRDDIIRRGMFRDLEPIEQVSPPAEVPQPWSKDQWQYVQQLRAGFLHLRNKVTELQAKRKPRGQY